MAVVLIIQFYGRGARSLASDENKTSPGFLEDMRDVLDTFGIPMPPMVSPIWKSGVVRGSYLEEDLTSVLYDALDEGLARARRMSSELEKYSIKFLKVVDERGQKCFASTDRERRSSISEQLLPRLSHSRSQSPRPRKRRRVSSFDYDATMEKLIALERSLEQRDRFLGYTKNNKTDHTGWTPPSRHTPLSPASPSLPKTSQSPADPWNSTPTPPNIDDPSELAKRSLVATRRELITLRSKESALVSRLKQLGGTDIEEFVNGDELSVEEVEKTVTTKQAQIDKLDADLRLAQQETQGLRLQLQAESLYRRQLETMLAEAQEEKKGQVCVPAMLEAINWLSQLSQEALHAARKGD